MNLEDIQSALREAKLDGWLFYDHHRRDAIAYRVLGINPVMCTRRWYYLIPAEGEPAKLVHRIEAHNLEGLPGTEERYSSWREQREGLSRLLHGKTARGDAILRLEQHSLRGAGGRGHGGTGEELRRGSGFFGGPGAAV